LLGLHHLQKSRSTTRDILAVDCTTSKLSVADIDGRRDVTRPSVALSTLHGIHKLQC
jgi:hypothetical protein